MSEGHPSLCLSRCPSDIICAIQHAEDSVRQVSIFRLGAHKQIPHKATNNELLWDHPEPSDEVCLVNIVQSMHHIQVPKSITNLQWHMCSRYTCTIYVVILCGEVTLLWCKCPSSFAWIRLDKHAGIRDPLALGLQRNKMCMSCHESASWHINMCRIYVYIILLVIICV